MSEKRKDNKGRILRTGEGQRQDGRYYFRWNTPDGKRHTEYANTLNELRDKEKEIERRRLLREDATDDIAPISIKNSDTEQGTEIQIAQITVERLNPKFCVNCKRGENRSEFNVRGSGSIRLPLVCSITPAGMDVKGGGKAAVHRSAVQRRADP